MSKSILVINTSKDCYGCDLCKEDSQTHKPYCVITYRQVFYPYDIPDWCPLKPVPEKRTIYPGDTGVSAYEARGYNRCINEILGK